MGWYYRIPTHFPATFLQTIHEASARSPERVYFGAFETKKKALVLAEQFRWFRWCIREKPEARRDLFLIVCSYDFRTYVEMAGNHYTLWAAANENKVSEFIRLNPDLADEVLRDSQ